MCLFIPEYLGSHWADLIFPNLEDSGSGIIFNFLIQLFQDISPQDKITHPNFDFLCIKLYFKDINMKIELSQPSQEL